MSEDLSNIVAEKTKAEAEAAEGQRAIEREKVMLAESLKHGIGEEMKKFLIENKEMELHPKKDSIFKRFLKKIMAVWQ